MLERRQYSPRIESFTCLDSLQVMATRKKDRKRFSDDQIRSLESMFESESKLDPRQKLQLATELGLHPRQVAIWFQNRRARWKSKKLERDYSKLRANYDTIASQFESLKKENQSLLKQLHKLKDWRIKPREESRCGGLGLAGNSTDSDSNNGDTKCESEVKPSLLLEGSDHRMVVYSEDHMSKNAEHKEPDLLMNVTEPADGSLRSPENWDSRFDSGDLFYQSFNNSQWWDIWS
ncbi:hypothetical protein HHK36_001368 [Tetracentron sinense]|uniref:Homeobox-leucine zipper protein n=1 Tax=Tetracentron sinense TaxID=13715 RepID=A0A835DUY5_TETSI|nr:hypothetical protein HHK36_001368 [Tetracentron sinense]